MKHLLRSPFNLVLRHLQYDKCSRGLSTRRQEAITKFNEEDLKEIEERLRLNHRLALTQYKRKASVLIPLTLHDGEASILFTLRTKEVSTHKGEVSFPGGMQDETDADAIECALRETEEEVGFARDQIRVLGKFNDAPSINEIGVTPVVGFIPTHVLSSIKPSKAEIDSIFLLPISKLIQSGNLTFKMINPKRGTLPFFTVDRHPTIWGLTGWILYDFLRKILKVDIPALPKESVTIVKEE